MPPASKRPPEPKAEHKPSSGRSPSPPTSASPKTARGSSPTAAKTATSADHQTREIIVTIPADKIFSAAKDVIMAPVAIARRVLPAKGGIPLYAGLGALAIAGFIEWPVAAAAGAGYALARHWTHQPAEQQPQAEHTP
jgi:hypothetical protein